jgi:DNA-binding transcriptional LysR family regulator
LSQPAVSAQVKQLESHVGMPLFEQVGKKVYLTHAGARMLTHSRAIIHQFREASESMQALNGIAGGTLVVTVISAGDYFFPHVLAAFVRANPGVIIDLRVVNRADLLRQVEENRTDVGVMGRVPHDRDIVAEAFAPHPYVLVAPPGHPLASKRNLDLAALLQYPFVVREHGSDTRHAMSKAFGARMARLRIAMEIASNETIKQAVSADMGLAFSVRVRRNAGASIGTARCARRARLSAHGKLVRRASPRKAPAASGRCVQGVPAQGWRRRNQSCLADEC